MDLSQWLTLAGGVVLAAASVVWAVREHRTITRSNRYPLLDGPPLGGALVIGGAVVSLTALVIALVVLELLPPHPALFALSLGWLAALFAGSVSALAAIQTRRHALGWVTLIGEDRLRVDTGERSMELHLRPGCVRLLRVPGSPTRETRPSVQFLLTDGEQKLVMWGQVGVLGLGQVSRGSPIRPLGPMLGTSAEPLRRWLAPFTEQV